MLGGTLLPTKVVLDFPITALRLEDQAETILRWAKARESKAVCVANVHMLMEAYWNPEFADVLKHADIVTPDGMPLVWMMRQMGARQQDRVAGMDIMLALCKLAEAMNVSVFFLGSQNEILSRIQQRLEQEFPKLKIAAMQPLPFRPLTKTEDEALIHKIHSSAAGLVLVSLGCPKQEKWMAQHKGKIQAVMIGLGGVFPVYAGIHKRAPRLVRELGFEWLYRWIQEPRRLWHRYTKTIPPFIWLAAKQLLASKPDAAIIDKTWQLESSVVTASPSQISSDLGGEAVILNFKSGVYHGLNEVGARIWSLIQEPKAVSDVKQILLDEYEVEIEQCKSDLMALLKELFAAGLIVINHETTT